MRFCSSLSPALRLALPQMGPQLTQLTYHLPRVAARFQTTVVHGNSGFRSVGVVGIGNVGIASAYTMFNRRVADELVLVDVNRERAEGEALDLQHGQGLIGKIRVRAGDYSDLKNCQIVVVTAGRGQAVGESRLDLLEGNVKIARAITQELDNHCPEATVVVSSNPVDLLTYVFQAASKRPTKKIFGTGTLLDTSRFVTAIGDHYGVDPQSVQGYILGEHGDSEVPIWSSVTIGGRKIMDETVFGKQFHNNEMVELAAGVKNSAAKIIKAKGYTNWAVGLCISRIAEVIFEDRRSIVPLSVRLDGQYGLSDVCLSVPVILGQKGVELPIDDMAISEDEHRGLQTSAEKMGEVLSKAGLK